jgi:non-specific serine/threonine protein kinase
VGKTRLAIEVAREIAAELEERVQFVALASVTDHELVIPAIARALEVQEAGSVPVFERLVSRLREQDWLLVLDNLEQIIGAAPRLAALLAACPRLTLLATSRRPLHISGEQEYPVPPLGLPDATAGDSLRAATKSEAVDLFVQRARAIRPDFALTADNAAAVAAICARLDGLPLAIELAAARIRLLPPHGLLARLDHRLALLTGGASDLPERQQTLRGAIAWSYDLHNPAEQRLFRGISVFPAGCTLDGAEAILDPLLDISVFDGIASLLDTSLLVRAEHAGDTPRYRMLETVREFAAELAEEHDEFDDLHQRVTTWALTLFRPDLLVTFGAGHQNMLHHLTSELDNLRSAVHWGLERHPRARELAGFLAWYYVIRGLTGEATALVERALTPAHADSATVRARLLWAGASAAFARREYDRALVYVALGEELATDDMVPGTGDFLVIRGLVASFHGAYAEAETLLRRAVLRYESLARPAGANHAQTFLAMTLFRAGDIRRSEALANEALTTARARGDIWCTAIALFTVARIARDRGDASKALAAFVESARLGWSIGDVRQAGACLARIAGMAMRHQQSEPAVSLLAHATSLEEMSGNIPADGGQTRARTTLAELQAELPTATFDAALQAGQRMTTEEAIAFAASLALPSHPGSPTLTASTPYGLTPRELEVLRLLVEDRSSQQIAEELFISRRTVTTHITNIFNKLGVNSRAAAVALALRQGLV